MKYEITEEQIKETYEATSVSNQEQLKEWFPKAFEAKIEVGKWYAPLNEYKGKCILFVTKNNDLKNVGYGIDYEGYWTNQIDLSGGIINIHLATETEVFEALKNEAVKRGFVDGVIFNIVNGEREPIRIKNNSRFGYDPHANKLLMNGWCIFQKGNWSVPLKTYTKEEAEKMINGKII